MHYVKNVFQIVQIKIAELTNKIGVAENLLSVGSTVLGSILLDEEENVVVPLIGIRLDVPLFDVFPFSDGFPMSYLLKE